VISAIIQTKQRCKQPMAIAASLPENMPEAVAQQLSAAGIVPLCGLIEALTAARVGAECGRITGFALILLPRLPRAPRALTEAQAKTALAEHGLAIPRAQTASQNDLAKVADVLCELLIGVVLDPAHGYVLTLGAGGTLTELLQDSAALLVPATPGAIKAALDGLKVAKLLHGYRGAPAANINAIVDAVNAVQDYVIETHGRIAEVEVNPLMCLPERAIATDALILIGDIND